MIFVLKEAGGVLDVALGDVAAAVGPRGIFAPSDSEDEGLTNEPTGFEEVGQGVPIEAGQEESASRAMAGQKRMDAGDEANGVGEALAGKETLSRPARRVVLALVR